MSSLPFISGSRALSILALVTLVTTFLLWAFAGYADAATTHRFDPVRSSDKTVVYDVKTLRTKKIKTARIEYGKGAARRSLRGTKLRRVVKRRTVRRAVVQRAARGKGRVVLRLPASAPAGVPLLVVETEKPAPVRAVDPPPAQTGRCPVPWGQLGRDVRPGACWRPYNDQSPFNQVIPSNAPSAPRSAAIVARMLGFGPIQNILPGRAGTKGDWGRPLYFSQPSDPVYTIRCMKRWGTCPIEGHQIRVPGEARPAGAEDAHLTVIDQETGWEYDFWQVLSKGPSGGELRISWGGRTRIDGDGLGSRAVAANFGTAAGIIRPEELRAGHIDHALFINVRCDSGQAVFPADHLGAACSWSGGSNVDAPAMGQRFQLQMSDAEIDALRVPTWKKAILRAMARYGMFVGDTGGEIGIQIESGVSSTSFGLPDPWVQLAKEVGAPYYAPDSNYVLNIRDGVDWAGRLRVVDPCVSQRTC